MKNSLAVLVGCLMGLPLHAADPGPDRRCQNRTDLASPCFTVRGRMFVANGTPGVRIWRVGTTRVLGVVPPESEIAPQSLLDRLGSGTVLYGNFTVCPLTPDREGWMQMVCVQAATDLLQATYSSDPAQEAPVYARLPDASLNQ